MRKASRADGGGAHSTAPPPMKSHVLLKSAVQAYQFPLHIAWQIGRSNNTRQHTSKKKTIHWTIIPPPPYPHPLPLQCLMTAGERV